MAVGRTKRLARNGRGKPLHIAVMMPSWVGDACMATPTLRAIRQGFPHALITIIAKPVVRDLLQGAWSDEAAWFDRALVFSRRRSSSTPGRWGVVKACRRAKIDVGVLLTNSLWSAIALKLAGVPRLVGYNRDARRLFLSERLEVPHDGSPEKNRVPISAVDYYLRLAHALGCEPDERSMQLGVTNPEKQLAERTWRELGMRPGHPTLVINSNAATDSTRLWPTEELVRTSRRIIDQFGWQVLLHCGPGEQEAALQAESAIQRPLAFSMGRLEELPIGLSKAILARAQIIVSTDSGPRHIGVALNRPVITLCGPTDPAWTTTYNYPEAIIRGVASSPEAPQYSMRYITSEQVVEAVMREIQRYPAGNDGTLPSGAASVMVEAA